MTTLPQGDLPKDNGILKIATQHNRSQVGIYVSVISGGIIRIGDKVSVE